MAKDESTRQAMGELADMYVQGLEDFEVGLSFLRQFFVDGSPQAIQAGKQLIWQGMGKLQKISKAAPPPPTQEKKKPTSAGTILKPPAPKSPVAKTPGTMTLGERMANKNK
jgi:hypothetical protein